MWIASQNGHVDAIRVLVELGADVNTPDNNGSTPMHIAVRKGHQDVVNLLNEYGAKGPRRCTIS